MKLIFVINEANRQYVLDRAVEGIKAARVGDVVEIKPPTRSLEQNALMWPYLDAFSTQLEWPVLIGGQWKKSKLSDWDWKDFLTGSFEGDARRMAMGMDGTGLVMLGCKTSSYSKPKMAEFITFMDAFGAQQNVTFRIPGRTE
jgi:hypothetical protein